MNEKLSFQNIADLIVQKADVPKKTAETFAKAFFDTITDTLVAGEETVKVKGLGVFKLVSMGSRESVNVSNGERIVIPGYKKVAFTPEDGVVEFLNRKAVEDEAASVSAVSAVADAPEVQEIPAVVEEDKAEDRAEDASPVETEKTVEELIQVAEPTHVEEPQDAFAGIDMLISTPESVEEVRQQYEEARARMEVAVEEARKANAEKVRLEKLLERLEANAVPESAVELQGGETKEGEAEAAEKIENQPSGEVQNETSAEEATEGERRQKAFDRLMNESPRKEEPQETRKWGWQFWTAAVVVFLIVIGFLLYQTFRNIEAVEKVQMAEMPAKPTKYPAKKGKPTITQPTVPVASSSAHKKDSAAQTTKSETSRISTPSTPPAQPAQSAQPVQPVSPTKPAAAQKTEQKPAAAKGVANDKKQEKAVTKDKKQEKTVTKDKKQEKTVAKDKKPEQKPTRPTSHVMQRGESLTRVSQKYYGTKDSVQAIIRKNKLKDPNNVPLGYVIKLP